MLSGSLGEIERMANSTESMRSAQEQLMRGIRGIASKLAGADLAEGWIVDLAANLSKLDRGIEALERAIARDEGRLQDQRQTTSAPESERN
jgi:hypothetical protein